MQLRTYSTPAGDIRYWVSFLALPDAPWLVFLPGLTADHTLFDKQIEHFEGKANCLVWDAPSHGKSRPFRLDWSMEDLATWLDGILEAEGVERPILIGQSMGGYTAQAYMQRFPGKAAGFVSIDSPPLKRQYYSASELWMLRHTKLMYLSIPWSLLVKLGTEGCSKTPYGQELMRRMMLTFEKREYCELAAHGFRVLADAVSANLPYKIDCPMLVLCGTKDEAGSCRRYVREWEKREGIPLVWVEGAGHNSNTDAPDEVNKLIEQFCEGL